MSSATATAAAAASAGVGPFTSMHTGTPRSRPRSRTASRLGIRRPEYRPPERAPASSRWSSSHVRSLATPLASVVSSNRPCSMTMWSSRLIWTSASMTSAPRSIARVNDSRVFAGTSADWPRWAMTIGRVVRRHSLVSGASTATPSFASSAQTWRCATGLALSSVPIDGVNEKSGGGGPGDGPSPPSRRDIGRRRDQVRLRDCRRAADQVSGSIRRSAHDSTRSR